MSERISFELLKNAFDYVLSAAEYANEGTPSCFKYAVIHLDAGLELLIKARLEKVHWALLFADIREANTPSFRSGDFRSVDFETAIKRLKHIDMVEIEESIVHNLRELRAIRNRLQHSGVDEELDRVKKLFLMGANLFLDFHRINFSDYPEISMGRTMDGIMDRLRGVEGFTDMRLTTIQAGLLNISPVTCFRCFEETLVIRGEEILYCDFCNYFQDYEDLERELREACDREICWDCLCDTFLCDCANEDMRLVAEQWA